MLQPEIPCCLNPTPGARLSIARGLSTNNTLALSTTPGPTKELTLIRGVVALRLRRRRRRSHASRQWQRNLRLWMCFFGGAPGFFRVRAWGVFFVNQRNQEFQDGSGRHGNDQYLLHRCRRVPFCVGFRLELHSEVGEFAMCFKGLGALGELLAPQPGDGRSRRMPRRQAPVLKLKREPKCSANVSKCL